MKILQSKHWRALAMLGLGAGITAAVASRASAESTSPATTASSAASPAAATSVDATSNPKGVKTPLHLQKVPSPPGPRPEKADWNKAISVSARRPLPDGCKLQLLGAWLRASCLKRKTAALTLVAGPPKDVSMWVDPLQFNEFGDAKFETIRYAETIFSLTRGESHVLQWFAWGEGGYMGPPRPGHDFTLSVQWDDTRGPVVVTSRGRNSRD